MIVYRITKTRYAEDLSGEGARLFGGRWNNKNTACLYTSESRALAILEYTVNVNADDIPRALSIATFDIPEQRIITIDMADLPGDWRQSPAPSSTKEFGTSLLKKASTFIIRIPSVIIPQEWNYLVNPRHPDTNRIKLVSVTDYPYDIRIKLK